jgi:hypothetical protein
MSYVQPPLNLGEGERLRDAGIAQTLEAEAHIEWRTDAYHWLALLAYGQEITSADLIDAVGMPPGSPNAVGAVIRTASMQGLIEPTERFIKSARPNRHAATVRVWRSL